MRTALRVCKTSAEMGKEDSTGSSSDLYEEEEGASTADKEEREDTRSEREVTAEQGATGKESS